MARAAQGARIVHVGPHKTGTTAVQWAFHNSRDVLAEHDIHYVGDSLQPTAAVQALTGHGPGARKREQGLRQWDALMAQARSHAGTVVLSSEFLCEADEAAARKVAGDVGPELLQVVITLRPLAKILPSQWQQTIKTGGRRALDVWLTKMLESVDSESSSDRFWLRHRHDHLVERWATVVGPENVRVIVVDSSDPLHLIREFAELAGLAPDLLRPPADLRNRSLTWPETEAIRAFNVEFHAANRARVEAGRRPLDLPVETRLAAWRKITRRQPSATEVRIGLPSWADDQVRQIADSMVQRIAASGVSISGDVASLRALPERSGEPDPEQPETVSVELAGIVAGAIARVLTRPAPA